MRAGEIGIVQDKGKFVRCVADTTGDLDNLGLRKGGREGLVGVETQYYEFPMAAVAAAIRKLEDCRAKCGLGG